MKKIAVLANTTKEQSIATAERIAEFLMGKAHLYMTDDCKISNRYTVTYMTYDEIYDAVAHRGASRPFGAGFGDSRCDDGCPRCCGGC